MAIKLRVLHYPDNKKLSALCNEISSSYENSKYDKIPPAYPCENEKLLVCFIKSGKELTAELKNFVGDLSKARAQNVFFIFGCAPAVGKAIEDLAIGAGTKLAGESKYVKFPALPFLDFGADVKKEIKDAVAAVYQSVQG
jgi:phage gpG-like protein